MSQINNTMSKSLLSSLRRGVNLNRKTASAIFSTFNPKALQPKTPYVIGVTNTYCKELFNIAVAQLRKTGVIPTTAFVATPSQLAAFLTNEQCALVQGFIAPRPKNRATPYAFENAEVTFVVARKGDTDMQTKNAVKMTHDIAELLDLPVEQILISKVGAVDPDRTVAVIVEEVDPFGGAYAGMLPNTADENDADFDLGDDTVELYTQADVDALKGDPLKEALKAASLSTIKGADGKVDVAATKAQLVGKPKSEVPF